MNKRIGILAALCLAFALCFTLVGCGGGVDKSLYTGEWTLESGSDGNLTKENLDKMKQLGMEVTLTLKDDGTGSLNLFGEAMDVTWEATSNTEGKLTLQGESAALKLENGKLTMSDSTNASMTFAKKG